MLSRNMILASLATCLATAIFLCVTASWSVTCLYLGTAALGFFISWQVRVIVMMMIMMTLLSIVRLCLLLGRQEKKHHRPAFLHLLHRMRLRWVGHAASLGILLHKVTFLDGRNFSSIILL